MAHPRPLHAVHRIQYLKSVPAYTECMEVETNCFTFCVVNIFTFFLRDQINSPVMSCLVNVLLEPAASL